MTRKLHEIAMSNDARTAGEVEFRKGLAPFRAALDARTTTAGDFRS